MKLARICSLMVVASMALCADATTYYWHCGEDASPLEVGNYRTDTSASSAVATSLPKPGDTVYIWDNKTMSFDDDSVAFCLG